jgi:hypothetical protein
LGIVVGIFVELWSFSVYVVLGIWIGGVFVLICVVLAVLVDVVLAVLVVISIGVAVVLVTGTGGISVRVAIVRGV